MNRTRYLVPSLLVLGAAGCGSGVGATPPDGSGISCATQPSVAPAVGASRIVDAVRESNCIDLEAGEAEREYLVVAYSGVGRESASGTTGGFTLAFSKGDEPASVVAGVHPPSDEATFDRSQDDGGRALHDNLRRLEREAVDAGYLRNQPALLDRRPPPVVGAKDQFKVCRTISCTGVNEITTTIRYVGDRGVIHIDDNAPAGADALTQADIDQLGALFDDYLYPLDTLTFGVESDIDSDGHIAIVITTAVNDLTTDCANGRTVGYFFGGDLLFSYPGSNQREVFFAFAPKPAAGNCPAVTRTGALRSLAPVLIHELQHMISFNQRMIRSGRSDHPTWLAEGLSHFAEELGQRFSPDQQCPHSVSCYSQFGNGNVYNARDYLAAVSATPLLADEGVTLQGRGAGWLFVRWLADQYATDAPRGIPLMRSLLTANAAGAAAIEQVTGRQMATLMGEWQLANWLDDHPTWPGTGNLRYTSLNLRSVFAANFGPQYPLSPVRVTGNHTATGTFRAGSGQHFLVVVPAGSTPMTLKLGGTGGAGRVAAAVEPRFAVVRLR